MEQAYCVQRGSSLHSGLKFLIEIMILSALKGAERVTLYSLGDGEGHVDALPTIVVGTYTPGAIGGKWNSGYGQGTDPRAWPYEFGEPRGSVRLSRIRWKQSTTMLVYA